MIDKTAEQTSIRRALLANGYTPLANVSKKCMLKDWPRLIVDDALIESWSDALAYKATGVRIEGPLVALDFDIDDAAALDAIWDALPDDLFDLVDAMPARRGGGAKVCLFCRVGKGVVVENIWSKAFYRPGEEDGRAHRLEVFGAGGGARQIGAYGAHTVENGEILVSYAWVGGRGLVEVPLADLPEVTVAQLETLADIVSSVLHDLGWVYEVRALDGRVSGGREFELEPDHIFQVHGGSEVGLIELEDMARNLDGVRVSMSWKEGASAANRTRALVSINPADDRVQVWDSMTGILYRPAGGDVRGTIERLNEKLRSRVGGTDDVGITDSQTGSDSGVQDIFARLLAAVPPEKRMFQDTPQGSGGAGPDEDDVKAHRAAVVRALLDRYGYWSDGRGFVVDVFGGIDNAMTFSSFQTKMAPLGWTVKGPRGGVTEVNPADLWRAHPERADIAGFRFLPDSRDRIVVKGDNVFINTWERPAWWEDDGAEKGPGPAGAGAVAAFETFLEHLIPDEAERRWFTMWLAAKVQKPWLPNCGVIMVAERQGTGRGTLFDILRGVFGPRHVNNVAAVQLIGGGSQAQYTDWIEEALIVTCDEVLAGDDSGGAMAWKRREVYERLKALIDPRPRPMNIIRKRLPSNIAEVFASFLLATNNVNALPLSADDRRIAVVTNTSVPLAEVETVMQELAPWRHETLGFSETFSAALFGWLREIPVNWDEVREAPRWMHGREAMLAANETDLDEVLENVLNSISGDFVLGHHLRERIGRSIEANGLDEEIKGWWRKAQDILARPNRLGWKRMPGRHRFAAPKESGNLTVTAVFYRVEGAGVDAWTATPIADRVALWSGGDSSRRASVDALAQRMNMSGLKPAG